MAIVRNNNRTKTFGSGTDIIDLRLPQGAFGLEGFFDNANAGGGNDTVQGNGADNRLNGGDGTDSIKGDLGNDSIDGGSANDRLFGEYGDDTLLGGTANDFLDGGWDQDSLLGGIGNDTLRGDLGRDTLRGEDGADSLDGGWDDDRLFGGTGNDTLLGDLGNDSLAGEAGADNLNGGNGRDTLTGGTENDSLRGGADNDTLHGDAGNDTVRGEDGADSVTGGDGNDLIFVDEAGQLLADADIGRGGAGDDRFHTHTGADQLFGDAGNDVFTYNDFFNNRVLRSEVRIDGGTGTDEVVLKGVTAIGNVTAGGASLLQLWDAFTSIERIDVAADTGNSTLVLGKTEVRDLSDTDILTIDGGVGDQVILAGALNIFEGFWDREADIILDGQAFEVYQFETQFTGVVQATVRIDADMGVSFL